MKTLGLLLLLGVVLGDETVRRTQLESVCDELNVGRRSLRGRPGGVTVRVYDSKNQLMSGTERVTPNQAITVIVTMSLGPGVQKLKIENATGVIRLPHPEMMSNVRFCKEGESSSERGDVIKWTWFMPGLGANTTGNFDFNTRIFYRKVMNNDSKGAMEGIDHNSLTLTLAPGEPQEAPGEHGPGEVPGGHKPRGDDETPSTGRTTPTPGTGEDPDQSKKIKDSEKKKSEAADAAGEAADDAHDSKKEAYMAAKLAEQRQKMADMEDANSEGNWQRKAEKDEKEHEDEIKEEMEQFEREKAKEEGEREERIREEIRDKEEHDKMEMERAMRSTVAPPTAGVVAGNQQIIDPANTTEASTTES